jgi:hypothetical protein
MTQPDGGQSPYDPPQQPQQPQQPEQGQQTPPGAVPGQPAAYEQSPYQQQAPQGPVYAQGGQPYGYGAAPLPKNNLGVWSLVLGILSVLGCGLFTGIAAIITGSKSRKAAAEGQADNGGMGMAGLIMGWIGTVLVTLAWIGYFVFLGVLVNSSEFQDSFEELDSGYSQDLDQELDQNLDQDLDELQQELDELEDY